MALSVTEELTIKSIQRTLANFSLYRGQIDGLFGGSCRDALIAMLTTVTPSFNRSTLPGNTYDAFSVYTFIQTCLARVGLYTARIDGKWGTGSQGAFDRLAAAYAKAPQKPNAGSTLPLQAATVMTQLLTEDQLKAMLPAGQWGKIAACLPGFNQAMELFEINTPLRKAHFMAQILHETAMLQFSEELASGSGYEGRADLGNTQPGDGKLFKGRGWLQITGRGNYLECQTFLRQHLNDPTIDITSSSAAASQLATNPLYASLASGYFWRYLKPKLNATADKDDVYWVSVYVNGWAKQAKPYYKDKEREPNGMADRVKMLGITKKAFALI